MARSIPRRVLALGALALSAGYAQPQADTAALTLGVYWLVSCEPNTASEPMRAGEDSTQYCLERSAVIDQTDVASAAFDVDATSKDSIKLTLHGPSAQRFHEATQKKIGLKAGVVLNGRLASVATIAAPTEHLWIAGLPRERAESVVQAFQRGEVVKAPPASLPAGRAGSSGRVYRVGGEVSPPIVIQRQAPEYSARARAEGIQGTVVLAVVIGADGIVGDIRVVRPLDPALDANAVACIREWRFRPAHKDGEPVAVSATIEINFRL